MYIIYLIHLYIYNIIYKSKKGEYNIIIDMFFLLYYLIIVCLCSLT